MEYSFFMSEGESKCASCVEALHSARDKNTPIRNLRTASASASEESSVSRKRHYFFRREGGIPDSLSVQLETVRLHGASTHNSA
jgi:hypothetical protein